MSLDATATRTYLDFSGFSGLRAQARDQSPEAVKEVASQFEAMFIHLALKAMRDATFSSGLLDNDQSKMYQGLLDQQLSLSLSGKLGLAPVIERQLMRYAKPEDEAPDTDTATGTLSRSLSTAPTMDIETVSVGTSAAAPAGRAASLPAGLVTMIEHARSLPPTHVVPSPVEQSPDIDASQRNFVDRLAPLAARAGRELGVDPRALLAQAALETGWGKHVLQRADGNSTHNLFGIKADQSWRGDRVAADTREHIAAGVVTERAAFRAYDSFADSFNDYVRFLKENPRYRGALARTQDTEAFVDSLQRAGFATDPNYAGKIKEIMQSDVLQPTVARRADGSGASG